MMTTTHSLVEQYLRRLDTAARSLPRQQREELMAEIREHLSTGLAPDATEAEVRNLLDDLGTPSAIIAAAQPDGPVVKRGAREAFAVVFLLLGFPPSSAGSSGSACCCGPRSGRPARSCWAPWCGPAA